MGLKKRHIDWENCSECGDELYSLTDEYLEPDQFYDGDEVFCDGCKKRVGNVNADGETCYISMDDLDE